MKKVIFVMMLALWMLPVGAQIQQQDHPALFRSNTSKQSLNEFREWFREAYLREFRHYRKEHKKDYKYRKGDFRDCSVAFLVDTTGRPHILFVTPGDLTSVQMDVLHATFDASPDWESGFRDGRKAKTHFTLPVRE